jgi:ParB-like chromosome segregation protein Spo0J
MNEKIEVEWVAIGTLKPNEWNPNVLSGRKFEHLQKELMRVGFAAPIVVSKEGTIINGEHRWRAAREQALGQVPVVRLDVDEATAKTLTMNLNSIHGQFDKTKLAMLVAGLEIDVPKDDLLEILDMTDKEMADLLDDSDGPERPPGGKSAECECPRCGHKFEEGKKGGDGGGQGDA